jgi:hypothetical protein
MAELVATVHWDAVNEKVVTTYTVLRVQPKDSIKVVTPDSEPFVIQIKRAKVVKRLGLKEAKNAKEPDLYQVPKAPSAGIKIPKPSGKPQKCGTLDADGNFKSWGLGFPLDD